jgi:hypothetical protein
MKYNGIPVDKPNSGPIFSAASARPFHFEDQEEPQKLIISERELSASHSTPAWLKRLSKRGCIRTHTRQAAVGAPGLGGRPVSKAGDFRPPNADRDFLSQEARRMACHEQA